MEFLTDCLTVVSVSESQRQTCGKPKKNVTSRFPRRHHSITRPGGAGSLGLIFFSGRRFEPWTNHQPAQAIPPTQLTFYLPPLGGDDQSHLCLTCGRGIFHLLAIFSKRAKKKQVHLVPLFLNFCLGGHQAASLSLGTAKTENLLPRPAVK